MPVGVYCEMYYYVTLNLNFKTLI